MSSDNDATVVFPRIVIQPLLHERHKELVQEALDLLLELWPGYGDVGILVSDSQWRRLRRLLLAIPELTGDDLE
jgi:hypothetical protein